MRTPPNKPAFPKYKVYKQDLVYLGSTKYNQITIPIYAAHNLEREDEWEWYAFFDWHHGQGTLVVWSGVDSKKLRSLLMHEFTHIVEALNETTYLSTAPTEDCTMLAQTMEKGMTELWKNLRLVPVPGDGSVKTRRRNA